MKIPVVRGSAVMSFVNRMQASHSLESSKNVIPAKNGNPCRVSKSLHETGLSKYVQSNVLIPARRDAGISLHNEIMIS
jgi:hypothetical protein